MNEMIMSIWNELCKIPSFLQKIFNLTSLMFDGKKLEVAELAHYFNEIASCNNIYTQMISLIAQFNEIRIMILNQTISYGEKGGLTPLSNTEELQKILSIIAAIFDRAITLKQQIEIYIERVNKAFTLTEKYIKLLGNIPVLVMRDENGKISFNRLNQ